MPEIELIHSAIAQELKHLESRVDELQASEERAMRLFTRTTQFFLLIVGVGSIGGAYGAFSLATHSFDLVNETKSEIRYIAGHSRPNNVIVKRIESGNPHFLPANINFLYNDKNEYYLELSIHTSLIVEGNSGKFIGWFVQSRGLLLDWRTRAGAFSELKTEYQYSESRYAYRRNRLESGTMLYSRNGESRIPVEISTVAPYTGTISFKVRYDTCEDAIKAADLLIDHDTGDAYSNALGLRPVIENYSGSPVVNFGIETQFNSPLNIDCNKFNNSELSANHGDEE